MLQLILKFSQPVIRESQKQFYAVIGSFRIPNLVRFQCREVIFLFLPPKRGASSKQQQTKHRGDNFAWHFHPYSSGGFAGCSGIVAGSGPLGVPGCSSRWWKSMRINSLSMESRSRRTICSGG